MSLVQLMVSLPSDRSTQPAPQVSAAPRSTCRSGSVCRGTSGCCGFHLDLGRGDRRRRFRSAAGGVAADPARLAGADGADPQRLGFAVGGAGGEGTLVGVDPAAAVEAVLVAGDGTPVAVGLGPGPGHGLLALRFARSGDGRREGQPVGVHRIGGGAGVAGAGAPRGDRPDHHGGGGPVGGGHHPAAGGDVAAAAAGRELVFVGDFPGAGAVALVCGERGEADVDLAAVAAGIHQGRRRLRPPSPVCPRRARRRTGRWSRTFRPCSWRTR